ncbi:hypothetical protein QR98_0099300 [Sarcoptes scabiei]|uniref:Uncharacterized protein n=1 Tax=Sarcoptes scabiei TaxID=52283 RepID=A0A132AKJ5_SARSC|nr:hypothetical protein QR98_0099300 [Sarcoptes scabiei]
MVYLNRNVFVSVSNKNFISNHLHFQISTYIIVNLGNSRIEEEEEEEEKILIYCDNFKIVEYKTRKSLPRVSVRLIDNETNGYGYGYGYDNNKRTNNKKPSSVLNNNKKKNIVQITNTYSGRYLENKIK